MAKSPATASCPSCAGQLPPDSQFCPQCGTRLGAGETLELNPRAVLPDPKLSSEPASTRSPLAVHHSHRRLLGGHPVPVLGALGSVALLLAIVLLAAGSLVGGLVLLALAIALLTMFVGGVRREPDAPAARSALRTADRLQAHAKLAWVSSHAWIRAGAQLLRIRRRRHQLRGELKATLAPLGQAVHDDDDDRARALKRQAAQLEQRLVDTERQASGVIGSAREEIEQARMTIQVTEAHSPTEARPEP